MATVPSEVTAVAGSVLTAAMWNSNVRDATNFLLSPPVVEVYQTVAQAFTNGGAAAVLFDSENADSDNMHSTSTNTSRLTCVTPGRYQVWGAISWASNATGARGSWYMINGSFIPSGSEVLLPTVTSGSQASVPARTRTVFMGGGDYVELIGWQSSGGTLNTNAVGQSAPLFGARWIGPS